MGLPAVEVAPGSPCDLLAVAGSSLSEVVATTTEDRYVLSKGELVARTRVERYVADPLSPNTLDASPQEAHAWR